MPTKEMLMIDSSHRALIEAYSAQVPVPLGKLAKELGVSDVKVASMQSGISGQISKENSQYIIRINRNESRERQRFTLAHELAHFLLHKSIIDASKAGITDNVLYRSGAPDTVEYEANRLAAELVMPTRAVREMLRTEFGGLITDTTIEVLAGRFGVSKAAMEIQLKQTHL